MQWPGARSRVCRWWRSVMFSIIATTYRGCAVRVADQRQHQVGPDLGAVLAVVRLLHRARGRARPASRSLTCSHTPGVVLGVDEFPDRACATELLGGVAEHLAQRAVDLQDGAVDVADADADHRLGEHRREAGLAGPPRLLGRDPGGERRRADPLLLGPGPVLQRLRRTRRPRAPSTAASARGAGSPAAAGASCSPSTVDGPLDRAGLGEVDRDQRGADPPAAPSRSELLGAVRRSQVRSEHFEEGRSARGSSSTKLVSATAPGPRPGDLPRGGQVGSRSAAGAPTSGRRSSPTSSSVDAPGRRAPGSRRRPSGRRRPGPAATAAGGPRPGSTSVEIAEQRRDLRRVRGASGSGSRTGCTRAGRRGLRLAVPARVADRQKGCPATSAPMYCGHQPGRPLLVADEMQYRHREHGHRPVQVQSAYAHGGSRTSGVPGGQRRPPRARSGPASS